MAWIVKENIVGARVEIHDRIIGGIAVRGIVRGIAFDRGFHFMIEVTESMHRLSGYGERFETGALLHFGLADEYADIRPVAT